MPRGVRQTNRQLLEHIASELLALRQDVAALQAAPRRPPRELLSMRQAAVTLGIGREQVSALVARGILRTTPMLKGRPKIAREELERFAAEGARPEPNRRPRRRQARRSRVAEEIAAIEI